jgi:hypothetical protein
MPLAAEPSSSRTALSSLSYTGLTDAALRYDGADAPPWEPGGNIGQKTGVNGIGRRDAESGPVRALFNFSPPLVTPPGAAPEPEVAGSNPWRALLVSRPIA